MFVAAECCMVRLNRGSWQKWTTSPNSRSWHWVLVGSYREDAFVCRSWPFRVKIKDVLASRAQRQHGSWPGGHLRVGGESHKVTVGLNLCRACLLSHEHLWLPDHTSPRCGASNGRLFLLIYCVLLTSAGLNTAPDLLCKHHLQRRMERLRDAPMKGWLLRRFTETPAFQIEAASNTMWLFYQTGLFLLMCEGLVIWIRLSD